jgi:hypothetical protein
VELVRPGQVKCANAFRDHRILRKVDSWQIVIPTSRKSRQSASTRISDRGPRRRHGGTPGRPNASWPSPRLTATYHLWNPIEEPSQVTRAEFVKNLPKLGPRVRHSISDDLAFYSRLCSLAERQAR